MRELHRQRRFATFRSVMALMLREMSTTYGRSPVGYLWAVLQPVAGIILLTLVFSLFLRWPPIGKSFMMFYATGIIPFLFYTEISMKLATSVQFSRQLLAYPSVTVVDALLARFVLNVMTQFLVAFILFGAFMMIDETDAAVDFPAVALGFAMAARLIGIVCIGLVLAAIFFARI